MKSKIGGQAVMEGVMMRGERSMALAVRDEFGTIRLDTKKLAEKKPWYRKVPFIRGVCNLFISMVSGFKIIGKSASIFVEDDVDEGGFGLMMLISILLGMVLAVALFIFLPTTLTNLIMRLFNIEHLKWLRSLIEGLFKLLILIGYMASISLMKEIKRVFMYHGAEHKTIACYEAELPLTVENVQKCSRYHDRCGTSFIVFVLILSIILMVCVEAISYAVGFEAIAITWVRTLIKLAMLPLTAAISYEMLMLLARTDFVLFRPLKWLGKQFQKLTTREPDDEMCEVALLAFNTVLEMDADTTIAEVHFEEPMPLSEFKKKLAQLENFEKVPQKDLDWAFEMVLLDSVPEKKRTPLSDETKVSFGQQLRLTRAVECYGIEPIEKAVGKAEFFGRNFDINKDVLVPRQETQLVAEVAIKQLKHLSAKKPNEKAYALDLCCGSGVLGITIAKEAGSAVTLADISKDALFVARYNNKKFDAGCKTIKTNMFEKISGKFDLIVSNPPYIKTADIETLDNSVKDEPHLALDGGVDGLNFYKTIAVESANYLQENGVLVLEIGFNQAESVVKLLKDNNFKQVEVLKDYQNHDRIIVAQR